MVGGAGVQCHIIIGGVVQSESETLLKVTEL